MNEPILNETNESQSKKRKRKGISKKIRFEVFKRDSFKCQYCGASAPDVLLVIDHIQPFSKNGDDSILNFITACQPCNAGKSDRTLSDNSTLTKQKQQLDDLNDRREQIGMMLDWRNSLKLLSNEQVQHIKNYWSSIAIGWSINESADADIKSLINKYGLEKVLDGIDSVTSRFLEKDDDGKFTLQSVNEAYTKLSGYLRVLSMPDDTKRIHYIKGILRNRFSYVPKDIVTRLSGLVKSGASIDEIEFYAKGCRSWTDFKNSMYELGDF